MKTIADIKLADTMPDSISGDAKVKAAADAIDQQLKMIADNIDSPSVYKNIDKLPSTALDHLAVQYNVLPWRDSWNITLKRIAIKTNIANKRKVGTLYAIKKAVESLGSTVQITPWHKQNPKGKPGTFSIVATYFDGAATTAEAQEDVYNAILNAKPFTRPFYLGMQNTLKGGFGVFGCVRQVTVTNLNCIYTADTNGSGLAFLCAIPPIVGTPPDEYKQDDIVCEDMNTFTATIADLVGVSKTA